MESRLLYEALCCIGGHYAYKALNHVGAADGRQRLKESLTERVQGRVLPGDSD